MACQLYCETEQNWVCSWIPEWLSNFSLSIPLSRRWVFRYSAIPASEVLCCQPNESASDLVMNHVKIKSLVL